MSAYGAVVARNRPTAPLASTVWSCKSRGPASPKYLSLHHLTLSTANELPGLLPYLHRCFAEEIERGTTYPQEILQGETYSMEAFESYYFAADVIVGIIGEGEMPGADGGSVPLSIEAERNGRSWEECVAGTYYVKPNYPGRSSHICNAGFLVPTAQRAKGFGSVLARSYLFYGPTLGYEASVFNLVYVNNTASVKLWDALGFTRAGRIPCAGRLRTADGTDEEYIDACVFYKRFDPVQKK